MKTVNYSEGKRLYPLNKNRYELVGSLISHIRKGMKEAHKVDPLDTRALNPDYHVIYEDPVQLAVDDFIAGKVEGQTNKN
ncbi:MAG: hypothetical protein PHX78_05840 [bacterium]|nr:hypothetical protein [bacterium]